MHFAGALFVIMTFVGFAHAFYGDATYFEPGLGACGKTNNANDLIVALSTAKYGNGSNCGRNIIVRYNGKSVQAKVVDKCPGCKPDDVDLSPTAFSRLANKSVGRMKVNWNFV
ncbi:riboflavine-aldehyde-forming enzyme [Crassisporium funariophilum]|nr:riboflavine-aldehyde-forming enzyme [Crassisporium funariophilum]